MNREQIIALCRRRGKPLLTQMYIDWALVGSDRTAYSNGVDLLIIDEASDVTPETFESKGTTKSPCPVTANHTAEGE